MARKILTDAGIKAAIAKAKKTGKAQYRSDGAIPRSHGGLVFYVHPNGTPNFNWRYSAPDGTKPRIKIGAYTERQAPGAFTLTQARQECTKLAAVYLDPATRDVRAHLEAE